MQSTLLLKDRFIPVASPALKVGAPGSTLDWPLIHFDWEQPMPIDLTWSAWAKAAGIAMPGTETGIRYSEESHAIQAAVAGQGVALLSQVLVHDELSLGLLQVCAHTHLDGLSYYVVRPEHERQPAQATIVESWLLSSTTD
ncbi:LysR substrate-binding domain-containing protein [Allopusillimonas ginsengisoli]|uniref:LysR substrate-binding domain-containing protein n=1 Tax=Allopusillimonas ginsengisoli TaxID=453575 RepID=UPI00101F4978|nr:LysR substrate-binding domain-containing protein [Allopusillimonas ginsengisoli]TEA78926.1 hypothetical protein ERE07_05880 [Allopusillimonas ginsengisoli]